VVAAASLIFLALLQEPTGDERADQKKQIDLDFSDQYKLLSEDLEKWRRLRKLFGIFGLAEMHIYPGRESGRNLGPPLRIWGNGFGTSLWRDPVTGWPLQ
jgi:hypothetical protein